MPILIECEFPSFFSYRVPGYSSQYALSSLFPGPSTVKLAIIATAIEYYGLDKASEIFEDVRDAKIGVIPPSKIITVNVLIRRLKAIKDFYSKILPKNLELLKKGKIRIFNTFEKTYGIRGYTQFSEPIKIIIDNLQHEETIRDIAIKIGRLGSYDSIVFCREGNIPDDGTKVIWPTEAINVEENGNYLILPVRDLKRNVTFEDINPFSQNLERRDKKIMKKVYYVIMIRRKINGKNWSLIVT